MIHKGGPMSAKNEDSDDCAPRLPNQADIPGMLALNLANETALSPLDRKGLQRLMYTALYCAVMGPIGVPFGFLIVLDQDASYSSPNFLWFRERLKRFAYIDRVVIEASARGVGHARHLYDAAFAVAREQRHTALCCEVNQSPPNQASDRFHARLGFKPVGLAALENHDDQPAKVVQYLQASL
jgi:uncharacterized protein